MFDPYRDWLGIYDERRPPTLYQILCVSPLETDPRAIEAAASRQLARLQNFLTGETSADAWRMLDEVALAKATLLDPAKRSAYDAVFGYAQKPTALAPPPPIPAPVPPPAPPPYSWGQPPPPAPVAAPPPMPAIYQQLTAQMGAQQAPPQFPPMVTPPPINVPANPFAGGSRIDEPSRDGLPTPGPIHLPKQARPGSKLPMFIGAGVLVFGVIAGGIILATQSKNNPPSEPEKEKQVEIADHTERKQPPMVAKKDPPKDNGKRIDIAPPMKKETPKVAPKNDPPPPVEIVEEFKQAITLRGHTATAAAVAVAADGKQLFSAGNDLAILSWTPDSDKPLRRHTLKENAPPVGLALMGGGKLAAVPAGATLYILDLQTNTIKREIDVMNTIIAMAPAKDGQHILIATNNSQLNDGQLRWWDIDQQAPLKNIPVDPAIQSIAVSPDSKYALTGNGKGGGQIAVWNLTTGMIVRHWKAHAGDVTALAFSPDGKKAISAGSDNLCKTWEIPTGNQGLTLKGHEDVPLAVAFTNDGSMMLSAGVDMTIRSWDAITGEPVRLLHKGEAKVVSLALDPKNRFVVAGQNDGGVQLLFLPAVRPDIPPRATWVQPPKTPLPTPIKREIDEAIKSVRERYKADFALTMPEDLAALYEKLLFRAKVGPEDPATRFALFQEARDVAGRLGRMNEAFKTIEARTAWFDTDDLEDKAAALKAAAQAAVTKDVAEAAVGVVEEAEKLSRPDIVDELLRLRELFPQLADAPEVTAKIQAAEKRWTTAAADREKSRTLAAELQKDPDSPAANLEYGKYLCFSLGDWGDGLPKLLKGNDASLQDLAKKEIADPTDPKAQADLGKAWFDYVATADELHKPGVLIRSKWWYEKSLEKLPASEKLAVAVRVGEINKKIMAGTPATLARPGEPVPRRGFNTLRSAMALESQWVVVGSDAFSPEGLVLKADGSLGSRFKMLDGSRVEFMLMGDDRSIKLTLNGETASFQPSAGIGIVLTAERRGAEIRFASTPATGGAAEEKLLKIAPNQLEPGPLTLNAAGPAAEKELRIKSIIVNGPVKPTN